MALCKIAVIPVHKQWSYCSFALSHQLTLHQTKYKTCRCIISVMSCVINNYFCRMYFCLVKSQIFLLFQCSNSTIFVTFFSRYILCSSRSWSQVHQKVREDPVKFSTVSYAKWLPFCIWKSKMHSIFLNEDFCILIISSLKFVPRHLTICQHWFS